MTADLNIKVKTIKLTEENIVLNLHDLDFQWFLGYDV